MLHQCLWICFIASTPTCYNCLPANHRLSLGHLWVLRTPSPLKRFIDVLLSLKLSIKTFSVQLSQLNFYTYLPFHGAGEIWHLLNTHHMSDTEQGTLYTCLIYAHKHPHFVTKETKVQITQRPQLIRNRAKKSLVSKNVSSFHSPQAAKWVFLTSFFPPSFLPQIFYNCDKCY